MKLRIASESVGWLNSVGPLDVSPQFHPKVKEIIMAEKMSKDEKRFVDMFNRMKVEVSSLTNSQLTEHIEQLKARLASAKTELLAANDELANRKEKW